MNVALDTEQGTTSDFTEYPWRSKLEINRKLKLPGIESTYRSSKTGNLIVIKAEERIKLIDVNPVEEVEYLANKIKLTVFTNPEVLKQA